MQIGRRSADCGYTLCNLAEEKAKDPERAIIDTADCEIKRDWVRESTILAFALTNEIFERPSHVREELDWEDEIADYFKVRGIFGRITWRTCSDWSRTDGGALLLRNFPYLSSACDVGGRVERKEFQIAVNKSVTRSESNFICNGEFVFFVQD